MKEHLKPPFNTGKTPPAADDGRADIRAGNVRHSCGHLVNEGIPNYAETHRNLDHKGDRPPYYAELNCRVCSVNFDVLIAE